MKPKDWDKISKSYFEELTSPFAKGVKNPLYSVIEKIKNTKSKSVIDLGTGIGNLVPFLSKNFKDVTAIDFSENMLKTAKKNCKEKNVRFKQLDMKDMKEFYGKFDVAVSINSILLPSVKDVNKIISEIFNILKDNGKFIGVFPSLNSVLYYAMLVYEQELKNGEDLARKRTYRTIGKEDYDFLLGILDYEGKQKHYYDFEIEYRLKKAGFKNINIRKVFYPWELSDDDKYKELFKNESRLWDWFVTAEK